MKLPLYALIGLFSSSLFFSCSEKPSKNQKLSENSGGTFSVALYHNPVSVFPISITSQNASIIASQIHEGLLRLNPKTLEPIPGLAEKWETSPDGKKITFHLVKGAHFQDDPCYSKEQGPEITSKDVLFSFKLLCTPSDYNNQYEIIMKDRLIGANDFYTKKTTDISGFKIIDDYTFSIELEHPSLSFMKMLANPATSIINETAYKKYGRELKNGAGPFVYSTSSTVGNLILVKNQNYYGKDSLGFSLPYLDSVIIKTAETLEDGLSMFQNNKTDLVNTLPSNRVKEIVEKNIQEFTAHPAKIILHREAEMISQFYVFNTKQKPFDNVKVRKAINYAIDKERLIDYVLQGQGIGAANHGITPNTFNGYDITQINGYSLDVKLAKQLLAEAGYPNGAKFPEVRVLVNAGNSRNTSVAAEIQKQLKDNLNINITFESLPSDQKYMLQMQGNGDLFRDAWVADYSSPESFLSVFVGTNVPDKIGEQSFPNTARYQNPLYDASFIKGRDSRERDSSYFYFMKAEQLLINDAVIIPLWYEGSYRMLNNKVKGFYLNPMHYYDLTKTYKLKS